MLGLKTDQNCILLLLAGIFFISIQTVPSVLGLWLGGSIISVIHIPVFMICACINHMKRRRAAKRAGVATILAISAPEAKQAELSKVAPLEPLAIRRAELEYR